MNMNIKLHTIYGNWTTRGLPTKHAKSPVASASCPVREMAIRELAYQRSASCPVTQFIVIAAMFV